MSVRTRFAPSPTGYLHVGSVRTALYSWLYAHKHGGQFILRIEDTDKERSTQESVQAILDGMAWLNLAYDEGPFYQTERMQRYKDVLQSLLQEKKAYRCYCSKERLEQLREHQTTQKLKPRYDGHCRDKDLPHRTEPYVVRFRNPEEGAVIFDDQVYGTIKVNNSELDDLVIARSDGMPTYNFAVVVDDWDMAITHVIRGDDHINNTPRQINMLKALNAPIPIYAHLSMILGPDGKRLSKRHGAVSVLQYKEEGFLPEALINYLLRLGWSYGDQEIFSRDEMIQLFDTKNISKSAAIFNPEKLLWLNHHYIKTLPPEKIAASLKEYLEAYGIRDFSEPNLSEVVRAQAERCKTLVEMAERSRFLYEDFSEYDEAAVKKNLNKELLPALQAIHDAFEKLPEWNAEKIHECIVSTAESFQLKMGQLAQPLRIAATGGTISPPIDTTLFLLGQAKVVARLARMIQFIEMSHLE